MPKGDSSDKPRPSPKFSPKRVPAPPPPKARRVRKAMRKDDIRPVRRGPDDLGMRAKIVFEDEHLMVVDKPSGMLTAGMGNETRLTLFDLVKQYLRESGAAPRARSRGRDERDAGRGPVRPRVGAGVIHRLDKEASGLLVFSKTDRAFQWLKEDFKAKRVHRLYTAVLEGEMGSAGDQGTIQSFLREESSGHVRSIRADEYRGPTRPAPGEDEDADVARPAVTHFKVLAVGKGHTLVQVRLETGRKHQIRVHFADKGHPLVGDKRYGAKTDPGGRIALHAGELGFTHPGTGMKERYTSAPPRAFFALCGAESLMPKDAPEGFDRGAPRTAPPARPAAETAWENVAEWYDELVESGESDHYPRVIVPGTVRMLGPREGMRVLDVACGQGVVSRAMAGLGAAVVGVDGAPSLIDAARARGGGDYHVGDARELGKLGLEPGSFDAATCVMALANIEPLEPVFRGIAALLKPGGRLVWVITHPAFRGPDQTSWGWDDRARAQYRRVDGYLSAGVKAIKMHPGAAPDVTTMTFHRPIQTYVRVMHECGFAVTALEEWPSMRSSQPGPRADAENRARREIPLFLAVEGRLIS